MKNATEFDVECLNKNWYSFLTNKMFLVKHPWYGDVLAHLKNYISVGVKGLFVMETSDGCPILSEYGWIHAVPKKQGTPAKPKRKHVKGTKPYLSNQVGYQVAYDPSLIKVGTKVLCRDKKIRTIDYIRSDHIHFVGCYNLVDTKSGLGNYISKTPCSCDIMKILLEKKTDKHIHDRYNGYTVGEWHFWKGNTNVPPVGGDVKVQVFCRGNTIGQAELCTPLHANRWYWKWDNVSCDIIAFRIVGDR